MLILKKVTYLWRVTLSFKFRIQIWIVFPSIYTWKTYCTFFMNAIKDDGGIPGFVLSAERILIFFDANESWATFKASSVLFVAEET